ncbi:redox-sensitive transcriptional activator SoxR [Nakamurella sp. GG22]
MPPKTMLTVADVAARSGFAPSALRYYEREQLIVAARTSGNQRRYERIVLRRLAFIRAARNVGLTLDEIRAELAHLPVDRAPTTSDWRRISKDWRDRLNERIAAIEALRDRLDSCIGCGCLSLKVCALYNPDDRLAGQVQPPGAALLPALLRRPVGAEATPMSPGVP